MLLKSLKSHLLVTSILKTLMGTLILYLTIQTTFFQQILSSLFSQDPIEASKNQTALLQINNK